MTKKTPKSYDVFSAHYSVQFIQIITFHSIPLTSAPFDPFEMASQLSCASVYHCCYYYAVNVDATFMYTRLLRACEAPSARASSYRPKCLTARLLIRLLFLCDTK